MKHKILGIIFLVVAAAAVVSGIYYWQTANQPVAPMPVHKDAAANWKTYSNAQYGFEVKYPPDWTFENLQQQTQAEIKVLSFYFQDSKLQEKQKNFYDRENMFVGFQLVDPSPSKTIDERACSGGDPKCVTISRIIDGVKVNINTFELAEGEGAGDKERDIEFIKNGKLFQFYSGVRGIPQENISILKDKNFYIDQILSTFKFTDSNPQTGKGILMGHADVGPICPVEQVGHPCPVPASAYTSRQVGVFKAGVLVTSQHLDASGNYKFDLDPGTYDVKASGMMVDQLSAVEGTVIVKTGETTTLNFSIDTGIR